MVRRFRWRHRVQPQALAADKGDEAGEFLRSIEEEYSIMPLVPISAARVSSPGPAGEARRRALGQIKTALFHWAPRARKKIEPIFGWLKQAGGLRKVRHVGRWKIQQVAYLWAATYNLPRMAHVDAATAET